MDGGAGYTYLDQTKGHEFSVVGSFTYNFMNTSTNYQSGVDFHIDWGAVPVRTIFHWSGRIPL
jgi:hypothetical protein